MLRSALIHHALGHDQSLGHSSIAIMAELYTHILGEHKREKAATLDSYLDAAVRPLSSAETAS